MARNTYGPCSEKQRLILQDTTTDIILIGGGAGGGKALRHGEKVLTPEGFINIENISVGDKVVTPENTTEKVLAVYPQGVVDIYRVKFQDGRTVDTCGEHLWQTHIAGKGRKRVRTTLQLKKIVEKQNNKKSGEKLFLPAIPCISPVTLCVEGELPIESIVFVGKDLATCISISGKNKLFITTNFIVTHNSRICLTKNLDGIEDPNFRCTIFRRTYPELKRQGGLIDESKAVYRDFKGVYKSQAMSWNFPSGASIAFSAIANDDDLGSWQGSQLVRALIDEAADKWTEKQVLFLLSRLRSAHSKIHPQLIMSCNPDINSFLKQWVNFCLDEATGVPVPGTENRIRWMITLDNRAFWADSPEECYTLHGAPRGMIFAHKMSEEEIKKHPVEKLFMPKSFRFIPTGVFDNPYLLPPKNNSYLPNLLAQPYVNQLKFLHGSWTAKEAGSMYFNRNWAEVVDFPPINPTSRIRSWDFAASDKTASNDPDWTVGVKMSRDKYGAYYIEDVVRFQGTTDKVLKRVIETAISDGIEECNVSIPIDPAAAGKTAAYYYMKVLAENGIPARTMQSTGNSGKLTKFRPFCALAESGALKIVKAEWNDAFFHELENFTGERSQKNSKDDQVDATSDAFINLARDLQIPSFTLPSNLTQASPIPTVN